MIATNDLFLITLAVILLMFLPPSLFKSNPRKLAAQSNDQRCPNCGAWQSDCGGWTKLEKSNNSEIDFIGTCGGCGDKTAWVFVGLGICEPYKDSQKERFRG